MPMTIRVPLKLDIVVSEHGLFHTYGDLVTTKTDCKKNGKLKIRFHAYGNLVTTKTDSPARGY